jgi:hypothetical protein
MERAGPELEKRYGDSIPRGVIVKRVAELCDCCESSVLPSDHCYNRVNYDPKSGPKKNPLFLWQRKGVYKFVGRGYRYDGPVVHDKRRRNFKR